MQAPRKKTFGLSRPLAAALAGSFLFGATACTPSADQNTKESGTLDEDERPEPGLEGIINSGELVVLTIQSPTTYRERGEEISGYEVDLTKALASDLNVDVSYRLYDNIDDLTDAIARGEGHIAAPGLSQRELRLTTDGDELVIGPAYANVKANVLCSRDSENPRTVEDLQDVSLGVVQGSGIEETLETLADDRPDLSWEAYTVASGAQIAQKVDSGALECAVIDSNVAAIAQRIHPELNVTFSLTNADRQLTWSIAPQSADLNEYLVPWFQEAHTSGLLMDLDERYYGHLEHFDYFELTTFLQRIDTRLPRYEDDFRQAAARHRLDWTILASQAYQESHWNPTAKSPTGVRGLMMLTRPTAKEVGVDNRLDPLQSIRGGALYMSRLYSRLPDSVEGYDRLWLAMAAYNVGYGHLLDARRLARQQGLDPDKWRNIKRTLPMLTKPEHYKNTRYGYARGYEPVHYVRRIREYDEALTRNVERPEQPPFKRSQAEDVLEPPPVTEDRDDLVIGTGGVD